MINGGFKDYYGIENNCKLVYIWILDKENLLFDTLVTLVILSRCEVWGCNISRELSRKVDKIQNKLITYNIKIKGNTSYSILFIEETIPPLRA